MKIAVIQASSKKDKNDIIFQSAKKAINQENNEIINFGILNY